MLQLILYNSHSYNFSDICICFIEKILITLKVKIVNWRRLISCGSCKTISKYVPADMNSKRKSLSNIFKITLKIMFDNLDHPIFLSRGVSNLTVHYFCMNISDGGETVVFIPNSSNIFRDVQQEPDVALEEALLPVLNRSLCTTALRDPVDRALSHWWVGGWRDMSS